MAGYYIIMHKHHNSLLSGFANIAFYVPHIFSGVVGYLKVLKMWRQKHFPVRNTANQLNTVRLSPTRTINSANYSSRRPIYADYFEQ